MTEFEKEALALLRRIAQAVEGKPAGRESSAPRPAESASDSDLDFYANGDGRNSER